MTGVKDMALIEKVDNAEMATIDPPTVNLSLMFERVAQNPDVSIEKLQALMDMQRQVLADSARAAFNAAFAKMQPEIPVIIEHAKTDKATYAPLEDIVEAVRPILARFGFGLSHRTEWPEPGVVKIVGVLSHSEGHERQSEFISPADTGPGRNAVQAIGSAVTYGRRYTTKDLLNIVTRGQDDDAKRAARAPEPDGYNDWLQTLSAKANEGMKALQAMWTVAGQDADLKKFAMHLIKTEPETWKNLKAKAAKVAER
jgi:hypothetical protein